MKAQKRKQQFRHRRIHHKYRDTYKFNTDKDYAIEETSFVGRRIEEKYDGA